jgi:cysteine desulfurase/selenocysteine lyase
MEHHSNIVPWQMVCDERGAEVRHLPLNDRGELVLDNLDTLLDGAKLLCVVHISNALGTINPIKELVERAHAKGVLVLVDGAQAAPHVPVDVQDLGCDFYALSSHKLFGPTGVGVLWGRKELLDAMPPYRGGGDMIRTVSLTKSTWAPVPSKFEAGTPNISGVIGFGAAIDYVSSLDRAAALAHEDSLVAAASEQLLAIPGIKLIGTAAEKAGVCGFVMDCAHPHDIGTILDQLGVAIRTGHHCAQPVMKHFGVPATARASFAFYNTHDEVAQLVAAVRRVQEMFS